MSARRQEWLRSGCDEESETGRDKLCSGAASLLGRQRKCRMSAASATARSASAPYLIRNVSRRSASCQRPNEGVLILLERRVDWSTRQFELTRLAASSRRGWTPRSMYRASCRRRKRLSARTASADRNRSNTDRKASSTRRPAILRRLTMRSCAHALALMRSWCHGATAIGCGPVTTEWSSGMEYCGAHLFECTEHSPRARHERVLGAARCGSRPN
jgi:hypothetical protein